jgi:hypothetical protein
MGSPAHSASATKAAIPVPLTIRLAHGLPASTILSTAFPPSRGITGRRFSKLIARSIPISSLPTSESSIDGRLAARATPSAIPGSGPAMSTMNSSASVASCFLPAVAAPRKGMKKTEVSW